MINKRLLEFTNEFRTNYIDKENVLFVSSVKMDENLAYNNLCYETIMSYNGNFFYQHKNSIKEATIDFYNNIFNEILNGKSIEEIKVLYANKEEMT